MSGSYTGEDIVIRPAQVNDAGAIAEIYNWYVENTCYTFDEQFYSPEQVVERIHKSAGSYPWLVLQVQGVVMGFAYGAQFRERSAYRFSVEVTIYLHHQLLGQGLGLRLYKQLIQQLKSSSAKSLMAVISLPNPQSVALHEGLGFVKVGHLSQIGFKFDRWIDTGLWQLILDS